jgi:hypothetical protein
MHHLHQQRSLGSAAAVPRRSPISFQVHKLRRGAWQPVQLRITPVAVERLDVASGGQRPCMLREGFQHTIRLDDVESVCLFILCHRVAGREELYASCGAGVVKWRLEFQHMGSPAVRLLKVGAEEPGRPFALCGQTGWRLRVFASPEREAIVRALQSTASQKLALQLAGEGFPIPDQGSPAVTQADSSSRLACQEHSRVGSAPP